MRLPRVMVGDSVEWIKVSTRRGVKIVQSKQGVVAAIKGDLAYVKTGRMSKLACVPLDDLTVTEEVFDGFVDIPRDWSVQYRY